MCSSTPGPPAPGRRPHDGLARHTCFSSLAISPAMASRRCTKASRAGGGCCDAMGSVLKYWMCLQSCRDDGNAGHSLLAARRRRDALPSAVALRGRLNPPAHGCPHVHQGKLKGTADVQTSCRLRQEAGRPCLADMECSRLRRPPLRSRRSPAAFVLQLKPRLSSGAGLTTQGQHLTTQGQHNCGWHA